MKNTRLPFTQKIKIFWRIHSIVIFWNIITLNSLRIITKVLNSLCTLSRILVFLSYISTFSFSVPFVENIITRKAMILSQTWGYHWNTTGSHGPEPYTREFQDGTQIPNMIRNVGFKRLVTYDNSIFDAVYVAEK